MSRASEWVIFSSIEVVKQVYETTTTKTGLKVEVRINSNTYETGRTLDKESKKVITDKIIFDPHLPKWNYTIIPD